MLSPDGLASPSSAAAPPDDGISGRFDTASPDSPEDAAKEFEKVFVRQFVDVMTENMFSGSLAGEGEQNWMSTQRSRQRDHLTDMITDRIVEAGDLQLSETLLRRWSMDGATGSSGAPAAEALEKSDEGTLKDPLPSTLPDAAYDSPDSSEGPHVDHAV